MLQLETANIVVVGNFNPYLISPEWLSSRKIWSSDDIHLALGALRKDGVQFRGGGVEWFVSSDRLIIDSKSVNCGVLAALVLDELPHTPLSAVGMNYTFSADEPLVSSISEAITQTIAGSKIVRWGAVLHDSESRTEVTCVTGSEGITFSVNQHRMARTATEAIEAAKKFDSDRDRSQELVKNIYIRAFK